ncbi:MAG: type I glyceraldehyde-3-phosphate dehydrogenase, partial [Mycobacterium sp.]
MAIVAINGLGRIGRAALKVLTEIDEVHVAAVNDLIPVDNLAYLMRYDSVYGRYRKPVSVDGAVLTIDGQSIRVYSRRDPGELPWHELSVELIFECTGVFRHQDELAKHLAAGARFVVLSAPARTETIATVVPGVNQHSAGDQIISCASCTTNCITPIIEIFYRRVGLARAVMTTVHAYTAGQHIVDSASADFRRGRAAAANIVPTSTGAALATTKALPDLQGRFDGTAIRVPVPIGSIADITVVTDRPTSVAEINQILREEAASDRYRRVLG